MGGYWLRLFSEVLNIYLKYLVIKLCDMCKFYIFVFLFGVDMWNICDFFFIELNFYLELMYVWFFKKKIYSLMLNGV